MRLVVLLLFIGFISNVQAQRMPEKKKPKDTDTVRVGIEASGEGVPLMQVDGSVIHIVGVGTITESYTETTDGYTIVLNKNGIYEYAKLTRSGDLVASGVKANNPGKREKKEIKYVSRLTPHLRYGPEKLKQMQEKNKEFYQDYNLEIEGYEKE